MDFNKLKEMGLEYAEKGKNAAMDLAERGKTQAKIVSEQAKLAKAQRQLGALVYSLAKGNEENQPLVDKYIEMIDSIEQELASLKEALGPAAVEITRDLEEEPVAADAHAVKHGVGLPVVVGEPGSAVKVHIILLLADAPDGGNDHGIGGLFSVAVISGSEVFCLHSGRIQVLLQVGAVGGGDLENQIAYGAVRNGGFQFDVPSKASLGLSHRLLIAFKVLNLLVGQGCVTSHGEDPLEPPAGIGYRTAHQQQRQGNQGGDKPQFPFGQALRLPLPERPGGGNIAVLHVVQTVNQIHGVHTYPSSVSTRRSLPRVLWSMEVTLLWLNPVIFPMASTESIYQ